jgi:tRNA pseudouridine38-40 synthase
MRYFLEVSYKGTNYAGFQVQKNANTIQGEIEKVLAVILKGHVSLTGSSRTDAGVHAHQNYFHFDAEEFSQRSVYNINALLPRDIVVKSVESVADGAHCRFSATSRKYQYYLSFSKDPFTTDTAWYFPYKIDFDLLEEAAKVLFSYKDYTSFSKRNTDVLTHDCTIINSNWTINNSTLIYNVEANRFLRGMVRGLVGTMLLVGRKKLSPAAFQEIIEAKDCTKVNFATPAHGLFLVKVGFPLTIFNMQD